MKNALLTVILLLLPGIIVTQAQEKQSPGQLTDDGFFFFSGGDYQEALYYLLQLEGTPHENANVHYKIGMCYLNLTGEEHKAIPWFRKALNDMSRKYSERSVDETHAPYHTWFYLGRAYRINNQLAEALDAFNAFKEVPGFDRNYNLRIVENEISACEIAKIIQDIPVDVNIENLGRTINNAADNYYPVISGDGHTLVFMTDLKFYDAIFMSKKVSGVWTEPENITPQVQSDGDAIPTWLSYDGTELLLVKGLDNNRDIFRSRRSDGFWTKMEPFPGPVNSSRAESFASLSTDGKTLFFASNRRGGLGEFDLYSSTLDPSGNWKEPSNLGPEINTPFNESSPYLSEDGTTLFFTSEGHYNMGGYDIFYSVLDSEGNWNDPINIGFPVNTTSDNMYYYPTDNGRFGYTSRILPDGFGLQDIYRIERIPGETGSGFIYDKTLPAEVDLSKPFVIKIIDSITGKPVAEIEYNPADKKFYYRVTNVNIDILINKK